jgi:hypothetical protein
MRFSLNEHNLLYVNKLFMATQKVYSHAKVAPFALFALTHRLDKTDIQFRKEFFSRKRSTYSIQYQSGTDTISPLIGDIGSDFVQSHLSHSLCVLDLGRPK